MKTIRVIGHPFLLLASFLFILISGKSWGGFYLLYLLLALPAGGIHALTGFAGVILLLYANWKFKYRSLLSASLNLVSVLLLSSSLLLFFYNDKQGYNDNTFYQWAPQISLVIYTLFALAFIVKNSTPFFRKRAKPNTSIS
ncbi:MAG: hypothetical protein WCF67_08015 [Chitinophagaceae bacterium]